MSSIHLLLLLTSLLAHSHGQCTWRGTAPLCNGKCLSGEFEGKKSPHGGEDYTGYGSGCFTGSKKYCCKMNNCVFHDGCRGNNVQIGTSSNGDGYKILCCPGPDTSPKLSSIKTCSENDKRPRGSYRIYSKGIRWADDLYCIGVIADLVIDRFNLRGPVNYYQTGYAGRTETMVATIRRNHIGTGTATTPGSRTYVHETLNGHNNDDAGHVLANILGGSGTDRRNLFPQSPIINRGAFAQIEGLVRTAVENNGQATYTVNLIYSNPTETRPSEIVSRVEYVDVRTRESHKYTFYFLNP